MKQLIIFIFALIITLSLSSAVLTNLPDYTRIGDCVNLVQIDNVTSQNLISVVTPERIVYINSAMTKNGSFFNYTFCGNNVSGAYTVNGEDSSGNVWAYDYYVNAQGKEYNSIEGIVYAVMLFILFAVFLLCLYASFQIPFNNGRADSGELISINYMKYIKIFMFMLSYVCILGISYFSWNLSYGILEFTELAKFFYFIYRTLFIMLLVLFPSIIILSFIRFIRDKQLDKMLERGLTIK